MATSTTAIAQNTGLPAITLPAALTQGVSLRLSSLQSMEVVLDMLTGFAAVELADPLAHLAGLHPNLNYSSPSHIHITAFVVSIILAVLLDRAGAYRIGGSLLGVRETACVIEGTFYASLMLLPYALMVGTKDAILVGLVVPTLLATLLIAQKQAFCALLFYTRSLRPGLFRAVVYGPPEKALPVLDALLRSPKSRLLPTACFSETSTTHSIRSFEKKAKQVKLYDPEQFTEELLRAEKVSLVVIASPISSGAKLQYILDQAERAGATILFGAEPHALGSVEVDYFELDGKLLYGSHTASKRRLYDSLKRAIDIVASLALILLGAIPMLVAAIAIKLDTRGPMFFRQTRIGIYGRPFTIFKFRTMHTDMCGYNASPADSSDPRITRVGKWLRKTSIDELPQLFNILLGDMTLVGPRPEMPFIVAKYSDLQMRRLAVKPGLTGLWQISEDRRYPIHENMHYDLYYLKYRSIPLDLALLLHTALFAIRGV
jgi:exopolysaccharide biosynthesis polyprenyl glycosylphosphotransferase